MSGKYLASEQREQLTRLGKKRRIICRGHPCCSPSSRPPPFPPLELLAGPAYVHWRLSVAWHRQNDRISDGSLNEQHDGSFSRCTLIYHGDTDVCVHSRRQFVESLFNTKEKQSRAHITEKAKRPQTVSLLQCFIYRSTFPLCFAIELVLYASFTALKTCKGNTAEAAAVVNCFICAVVAIEQDTKCCESVEWTWPLAECEYLQAVSRT